MSSKKEIEEQENGSTEEVVTSNEPSIDDIASTHLGGTNSSYAVQTDQYDKELLVALPRQGTRELNKIESAGRNGFDVWHCYESTFLLNNGAPMSGTLKFSYSASGPSIVESKSMKLYLNSFDMAKMGDTLESARDMYMELVKTHLEELLKVEVNVQFFWVSNQTKMNPFLEYEPIELQIDITQGEYHNYNSTDSLVKTKLSVSPDQHVYKLYTNSLRSRCRVTNQKDSGSVYFHIITKSGFELELYSLFQQVVSLREKNEFHEPCCELLTEMISKCEGIESVMVTCMYSRRGSLDINPIRSSDSKMLLPELIGVSTLTEKVMGQ